MDQSASNRIGSIGELSPQQPRSRAPPTMGEYPRPALSGMELAQIFLLPLSLMSTLRAHDCCWPNGSEATNLRPCGQGPDESTSACCYESHYCLSKGLCYEPHNMTTYRAGCTDKNFRSQRQQWHRIVCRQTALGRVGMWK
ncbi:hypothetical protein J3459_007435 [Metarhizium acridum]|nr:hypothetical protein J3459_007435 [Metarhizium acridum]